MLPIASPTGDHTNDCIETQDRQAAIRELYIAHKLSYIAANAQLRLFCGMGEHKADMFLSDQPLTAGGSHRPQGFISRDGSCAACITPRQSYVRQRLARLPRSSPKLLEEVGTFHGHDYSEGWWAYWNEQYWDAVRENVHRAGAAYYARLQESEQ